MDGRARARSVVEDLTSAWLAGDYATVSRACTADVCWWTPLATGTADGPTEVGAALRRVLAPLRSPIAVTAVVPSDDGTRCVVEMRSAAGPTDARPAFVTSVLTLRDGKVAGARTYTDLRGPGGHPDADEAS
jgi:ketosteroid isomerase-like protein